MKPAADFLAAASLDDDEVGMFMSALKSVADESHRAKPDYIGFKLTVPPKSLSPNVAKAIQIALHRDGWNVDVNLMAAPPRFEGGAPVPVHWQIIVMPTEESYNAATVRFHGTKH